MRKVKRVLAGIAAGVIAFTSVPLMGNGGEQMVQECVYGAPGENFELLSVGQSQRSQHYTLENNELVLTLASATGNNTFRTSIVDAQSAPMSRYITTTSFGEAWYTDASGSEAAPVCTQKGDYENVMAGHIYEARYKKDGKNYTVTYTDFTDGKPLFSYEAKETNLVANAVYAYVNCLSGAMRVYKGSPKENGFKKGDLGEMEPPTHGTDLSKYVAKDELKTKIPDDYQPAEEMQKSAKKGEYDEFFLKDGVQKVEITMDEKNLNYVLQNSATKEYAMADKVVIGDKEIGYVGLKTKGNFTREHTDGSDSDRFSFTINFGKYVNKESGYAKKQNFYGLGKVSFNNFFFDKTMVKEYNALRLMTEMGLPTIQYGLALLYINGECYGVYSMLENFDSSVLKQYYNTDGKELANFMTKPAHIQPKYTAELDALKDSSGNFTLDSIIAGGGLVKAEDGTCSASGPLLTYAPLWESDNDALQKIAEELPGILTWMERLTNLAYGKDTTGKSIDVNSKEYLTELEKVIDVDEALRYFAAHSFLCQMDNMFTWKQNYGLYVDKNMRSLMVPWDYDLAWGCDGDPSTPQALANYNIDMLYNNIAMSVGYTDDVEQFYKGREEGMETGYPLFQVIFQNKSLREKFHTYMEDCAKLVALGGKTSFGTACASGRYGKTMSEIRDKVIEAASIELPEHVSYLNARQPDGAESGIDALRQIMTLRAVGVYLQTNGIEALVSAFGVPSGRLGNDLPTGGAAVKGEHVAAVDGETGIFTIAGYGDGQGGPKTIVTEAKEGDKDYQAIQKELSAAEGTLKVYDIETGKKPDTDYQIYIPVKGLFGDTPASVYTYDKEAKKLTELMTEQKGDMTVASAKDISCMVVYAKDGSKLDAEAADRQLSGHRAFGVSEQAGGDTEEGAQLSEQEEQKKTGGVLWLLLPLCVALAAVVILTLIRKMKSWK